MYLRSEGGGGLFSSPCEVLVAEARILHEAQDVGGQGVLNDVYWRQGQGV